MAGCGSTHPTPRTDPELGRLAVALNMLPSFRLWVIARDLTRHADGSGVVLLSALVAALPSYLGSGYTPRQLRRLITSGEGVFWVADEGRLFVRSAKKVSASLVRQAYDAERPDLVESNLPGVREVYVSLYGGLGQVKANLYAAWLTHRDYPTIARETLARLFSCSVQTLHNWEDRLPDLERRRNYAQCPNISPYREQAPDHAYTAVCTSNGQVETMLTWQMPNTYIPHGLHLHRSNSGASKVRRAMNHLFDQLGADRPADPCRGGQRSKLYWDNNERFYRRTRKRPLDGMKYVFSGVNRYGYNIWDFRHRGYGNTTVRSRPSKRVEAALMKRHNITPVTGWGITAAMSNGRHSNSPAQPVTPRPRWFSRWFYDDPVPVWFDPDRIRHKIRRGGLSPDHIDQAQAIWEARYGMV